jgi:DNA-binding Lrp family transcriptional regulator
MVSRARSGLRDRWINTVFADGSISDACRVLLLFLARHMTDAGRVSVPRETVADELGIQPRRVTARITEATRAGLLSKRGGGYNGRTAEYEALLKVAGERPPSPPKGGGPASTFCVHLEHDKSPTKVDVPRPPIARAYVSAPSQRNGNEHDSRTSRAAKDRDEEKAPADPATAAAFRDCGNNELEIFSSSPIAQRANQS